MPTRRVLVVSSELGTRQGISEVLAGRDFDVRSCAGGAEALEQLDESPADLVLSELGPRGADGVALLGEIRERHPGVPIVFIVGEGEPELAERALEAGADDFVARPLSAPLLIARIENTLDATRLRRRIEQLELDRLSPGIVAASPSMIAILDKLPVVAQSSAPVLVTGESGTGKEVVARAIHRLSGRSGRPFVPVNCGAIPEDLLESELFGHRKGAFTGAVRDKAGLFVDADRGTLFLDEIGDLPAKLQVKILRVLEEHELRPVGANRTIRVDARIVSATNVDLALAIHEGRFRQDLYYRLATILLRVPPLRERPEDIAALAETFLRELARETGRPELRFSPAAMARLDADPWPGNIRQLRNRVFRAVLFCKGEEIGPEDVAPAAAPQRDDAGHGDGDEKGFEAARLGFEREFLFRGLRRTEGNVVRLAAESGLARRTVYKLLARHGLQPARFRRRRGDEADQG